MLEKNETKLYWLFKYIDYIHTSYTRVIFIKSRNFTLHYHHLHVLRKLKTCRSIWYIIFHRLTLWNMELSRRAESWMITRDVKCINHAVANPTSTLSHICISVSWQVPTDIIYPLYTWQAEISSHRNSAFGEMRLNPLKRKDLFTWIVRSIS